jgi:hypothetical protein
MKSFPIGTIRVRSCNNTMPARDIKYRDVPGATGRNWMRYARWWWINNRGPIPRGKVVLHLDGDSMNDAPENLALGTSADALYLLHERRPDLAAKHVESMRRGTREHNQLRGRLARLARWFPFRWYGVDHTRRTIINVPCRTRNAVWLAAGFTISTPSNGRGVDAQVLGWPGVDELGACILAALLDGPLATSAMRDRASEIRRSPGRAVPKCLTTWYSVQSTLGQAGMIVVERQGRRDGLYRLTGEARRARRPWSDVRPYRGRDLERAGFTSEYARLSPDAPCRERITARDGMLELAKAIAAGRPKGEC